MTTDSRLKPFIAPAIASHAKFYPRGPFVSIILAQWAIESAWGTAQSGKNNYFGIKANQTQLRSGAYTMRWTHETLHGEYVKITDAFADYNSIEDCFDAHAYLLCSPHYYRCVAAPNPSTYAHALFLSGYATGIPGHPYDQALISLIRDYDLTQFDPPTTIIPPKGTT